MPDIRDEQTRNQNKCSRIPYISGYRYSKQGDEGQYCKSERHEQVNQAFVLEKSDLNKQIGQNSLSLSFGEIWDGHLLCQVSRISFQTLFHHFASALLGHDTVSLILSTR